MTPIARRFPKPQLVTVYIAYRAPQIGEKVEIAWEISGAGVSLEQICAAAFNAWDKDGRTLTAIHVSPGRYTLEQMRAQQ